MAGRIIPGQTEWSLSRDSDGHREYKIKFRIESDPTDGPTTILATPGLPRPGDPWHFDNDLDPWATCKLDCEITPVITGEPNTNWDVEFRFSTKGDEKRCKDEQIEDPLLQPQEINGAFNKYTEEAAFDRFGMPIVNSAWELMRGSQVEFDNNRPTLHIKQNVMSLDLALMDAMIDTVNAFPIWGKARRTVKLSNISWEEKYYGKCYRYYTRSFDFDFNPQGFDRDLLDEGTKVLNGHWDNLSGDYVTDRIGGLTVPQPPTLKAKGTGGTLLSSTTYGYGISALGGSGETLASTIATITTPAAVAPILPNQCSVTLSWPAVAGATGYLVYGRTNGAPKLLPGLIVTTNFTDDGSRVESVITPPASNTTGGIEPNRFNPNHFVRFKDRYGEHCKVILDGAGLPAESVIKDHYLYICINANTQGKPVTDLTYWLPLVGPKSPPAWNSKDSTEWVVGNVVSFQNEVYLLITAPAGVGDPKGNNHWMRLEDGINNRGFFDITSFYSTGDYVQTPSQVGKIHVEKYGEANFLLLGVPTTIGG